MKKEKIICIKCEKECKPMIDSKPTWFGKYQNDRLITAICSECWDGGYKWKEVEGSFKK